MTPTGIEWTEETWNPVTGCDKVSPGCAHCYAETFAERFRGVAGHPYELGFDLQLRPERLRDPLKWRKPRTVFVNSMSDLFHPDIPPEYLDRVFETMTEAAQHTFQVLTKRPERAVELAGRWAWPPNVWMGVSVENQRWTSRIDILRTIPTAVRFLSCEPLLADRWAWPPNVWMGVSVENQHWTSRVDILRAIPAAVRFLSCEPLLAPLDLDLEGIDWVIAGGESGAGARPMAAEWARSLRDQCVDAAVPYFFKQWGEHDAAGVRRGKKAAGRLLDGQLWSETPERDLGHKRTPGWALL